MTSEEYFNQLITEIPNAVQGKMFGAIAIKMPNEKAGAFFKNDKIIVKISGDTLEEALKLNGVGLFTPKENHPMNLWYEISFEHKDVWKKYAEISCADVAKLEVKPKKSKKIKK